jgi:flagellar hook-length control protein FliK
VAVDFDALLAGSLGTGLPLVVPQPLPASGVSLPAPGQILPPDGPRAVVSTELLAGQGTLTTPVLAAPTIPAAAAPEQFASALQLPSPGEQPPTVGQPAPNPADPRPLPALGPAPVAGTEAPPPPPPPTTAPVVATSMAAAEAPPVAPAAVAARGGTAAAAVGQRREVSVAPGSRPAPEASVARPASDAVAAAATAERKEADSQPGLERQASDPGTLAGQAALRPERTLPHDLPAATLEATRDGIKEQLGTPRWQQELGQRLVTLAGQGVREVRLQLHPEHLGPLEVRITLHDSQVGLWFGAQHAETRDALEQSLPRLREMFTQGGLTMTDASVAQHQHDRGNQTATARDAAWNTPAHSGAAQSTEPVRIGSPNQTVRLVDEYA